MSASRETASGRNESPDPSSHSLNSYDVAEEEWVDDEDEDGMDYEPTTDESEDIEFFETTEEDQEEDEDYQGTIFRTLGEKSVCRRFPLTFLCFLVRCRRWTERCGD